MHEGNVVKDDRDMLGGILDIRNMVTGDIMIHRSKVFAINIDTLMKNYLKQLLPQTIQEFLYGKNTG